MSAGETEKVEDSLKKFYSEEKERDGATRGVKGPEKGLSGQGA